VCRHQTFPSFRGRKSVFLFSSFLCFLANEVSFFFFSFFFFASTVVHVEFAATTDSFPRAFAREPLIVVAYPSGARALSSFVCAFVCACVLLFVLTREREKNYFSEKKIRQPQKKTEKTEKARKPKKLFSPSSQKKIAYIH